jgi:hypothetical protein
MSLMRAGRSFVEARDEFGAIDHANVREHFPQSWGQIVLEKPGPHSRFLVAWSVDVR